MVKISGEKFNKFLPSQDRFSSLKMLLYYPCISGSFDLVIPTPSPFGPTFDYCWLAPSQGVSPCGLPSVVSRASAQSPRSSRPLWRSIVVSNYFALALFLRNGHLGAPEFHGIFQTANSKTGVWTTFLGCVSWKMKDWRRSTVSGEKNCSPVSGEIRAGTFSTK